VSGECERGRAVEHDVDDGCIEFGGRAVRIYLGEAPRNDDARSAAVAAKLLDIHGDQNFVLQNQNPHSRK
jgi:hypothetical protein